jgi:hypothetical protein
MANGFRRKVEQVSPVRRSEVIEFSSRIRTKAMCKHNGNPHTSFGLGLWPGAGADISGSVRPAEGGRNCSATELSPAVDYDSSPEGAVVKVSNEVEVRSVVVPTQHGSS